MLLEAVEAGREDGRGFRARVSDFGLARAAQGGAPLTTATFGTCSHMAPELMSDGVLTKAADVWSFGVIAWEVYRCGQAAGRRGQVSCQSAGGVRAVRCLAGPAGARASGPASSLLAAAAHACPPCPPLPPLLQRRACLRGTAHASQ